MASPTRWTGVWVDSGSWWWTGRLGVLWFVESHRVGQDWAIELNWRLWWPNTYGGEKKRKKLNITLFLAWVSTHCQKNAEAGRRSSSGIWSNKLHLDTLRWTGVGGSQAGPYWRELKRKVRDAVLRSNKDARLEGGSDKGVDQMVREEMVRRRRWAWQERTPKSSKRDGRKTVSQKSFWGEICRSGWIVVLNAADS